MSSANPWSGLLNETVTATPDFIAHCMQRAGEHLKAAENSHPSDSMFDKHVEMAKAYAAVLKAIR